MSLYVTYDTLFHSPNWTNVVLHRLLGLNAKTRLRTRGGFALESITSPYLAPSLPHDMTENKHLSRVRCQKVCL